MPRSAPISALSSDAHNALTAGACVHSCNRRTARIMMDKRKYDPRNPKIVLAVSSNDRAQDLSSPRPSQGGASLGQRGCPRVPLAKFQSRKCRSGQTFAQNRRMPHGNATEGRRFYRRCVCVINGSNLDEEYPMRKYVLSLVAAVSLGAAVPAMAYDSPVAFSRCRMRSVSRPTSGS